MTAETGTNTHTRKTRAVRIGVVKSSKCDKTINVVMNYRVKHPVYDKYIRRRTKLHVHDENNDAKIGDTVEIMESRPLSKTKKWRLVRVVQRAER